MTQTRDERDDATIRQILELYRANYITLPYAVGLVREHTSRTSLIVNGLKEASQDGVRAG